MSKDEQMVSCIMDRFAGGLLSYMDDFYASTRNGLYKPIVNYSIPHADYISEHAREIQDELRTLKPVYEYSEYLKDVAVQYLPLFLEAYPQYKNAKCLSDNQ